MKPQETKIEQFEYSFYQTLFSFALQVSSIHRDAVTVKIRVNLDKDL